jgi:serine/threonine-protein kinase
VISQDPPGGSLADQGSKVTIVVSKGQKQVTVPDLSGLTVDEARAKLGKDLTLGNVTEQESTQPQGTIVSQSPPAGSTANRGDPVDVVVAKAAPSPTPIPVTDFTCESLGHAESELEHDGFQVETSSTPQFNPSCPQDGKVAAQSPSSGSFPPGTVITLTPTTKESPTPEPT